MTPTVIIPAYGRPDMLGRCLRAWRAAMPDGEVIVFDNADLDSIRAVCRAHGTGYLCAGANVYFAAAANAAAEQARGDLFVFAHDDLIVQPDVVPRLLASQEAAPRVVGGVVAREDGSPVACGLLVRPGAAAFDPEDFRPRAGGFEDFAEGVAAVDSCLVAVPRKLFEDAVGYDERFVLDYYHVDLCWRLGAEAVTLPLPGSVHLGGGGRPPETAHLLVRDPLVFCRKWFGASAFFDGGAS